ncbi:unnamed protein product [Phytophthora fragariaefolia]|uniref:Endonuclease III homolog n=1 Tax=Phytophthora fragariaefolia TaxID=1490495 RepID=A0A9W6TZE3_9STRA|nr:unnamed protein product [Phytophthora fragariaefolia]
MTLPLDERLEVDNVDSFLILRSPDASLKAPQNAAIADATPTKQQPAKTQSPAQTQTKSKQQHQQQLQTSQAPQQDQQQERPPSQSRNRGRSRNKRDDSKRRGSNATNPTAILQRSPKGKRSNSSSSGASANGSTKQEPTPVATNSSGMIPISKADGIAAGEAIMGMFAQNQPQQQQKQSSASNVSKEQLKQTLIGLLDDAQFFDQIYHAGDGSINPFSRFAFASATSANSSTNAAQVKDEIATHQPASSSVKRARDAEEAKKEDESPSRPTKLIKTESVDTSERTGTDRRLELLLELYKAREGTDTPIDEFGTQACVATGVSSAKVERFQLVVAALLSSQTQDPITYAAMQRLHQLSENVEGLTIETVQATSEEELSEVLKPVGFYHRKAQQLKRVAAILRSQFHGDIPRSLDDLLGLPGIGPKIGRVITLLAWGQVDGIVVDTHVHRLAQRLGWASTTNPEDTRRELEEWIPREHWGKLSLAVVGFGQTVCTAKYPSCSSCPLAAKCPSAFKVEPKKPESKKSKKTST